MGSFTPELKVKEVYVLFGLAGSGKTHKVYTDNDISNIYKVKYGNNGIWWDGYDHKVHTCVLFDEFVG